MMNVAVCDESRPYCVQFADMLRELADEDGIEISVDVYPSYSYLQNAMKDKRYDLLLLETSIRGISGIDFARGLRLQKNNVDIIFISQNADAALAAYNAFPVGYIVKPAMKKRLRVPFRHVAERFAARDTIIMTAEDGGKQVVAINDILYIEVIGTELTVHTRSGVVNCTGSLSETVQKLPERQFYRSHRSFIVNMNYIVRSSKYYFVMENGDKVAIAKNRYAEAKGILGEYVGK